MANTFDGAQTCTLRNGPNQNPSYSSSVESTSDYFYIGHYLVYANKLRMAFQCKSSCMYTHHAMHILLLDYHHMIRSHTWARCILKVICVTTEFGCEQAGPFGTVSNSRQILSCNMNLIYSNISYIFPRMCLHAHASPATVLVTALLVYLLGFYPGGTRRIKLGTWRGASW
jgi:hypothetical protein